jgi:DNA-directed RNA polymerase subunit N (RpoN/RPB10)
MEKDMTRRNKMKAIKCYCCNEVIAKSVKELKEKIDEDYDEEIRIASASNVFTIKGKRDDRMIIFCSKDCCSDWFSSHITEMIDTERSNKSIEKDIQEQIKVKQR